MNSRGINPSNSSFYSLPNGSFTCLDGSATLPLSAVNDDYCDCTDGSDEPGTSACPNGVFWCRGIGGFVSLPSSRVNDGICDSQCCDGSDEYSSGLVCPISCPLTPLNSTSQQLPQQSDEQKDRQMDAAPSGFLILFLIIVAYSIHSWLGARRRKMERNSLPLHNRRQRHTLLSKRNFD